jgi:hypothetical protein
LGIDELTDTAYQICRQLLLESGTVNTPQEVLGWVQFVEKRAAAAGSSRSTFTPLGNGGEHFGQYPLMGMGIDGGQQVWNPPTSSKPATPHSTTSSPSPYMNFPPPGVSSPTGIPPPPVFGFPPIFNHHQGALPPHLGNGREREMSYTSSVGAVDGSVVGEAQLMYGEYATAFREDLM